MINSKNVLQVKKTHHDIVKKQKYDLECVVKGNSVQITEIVYQFLKLSYDCSTSTETTKTGVLIYIK